MLPVYGCQTKEDFKRILPYVRPADVETLGPERRDLINALLLVKAGRCREFGAGEEVLIEKTENFMSCITPKGATDCYWVRSIDAVDAVPGDASR